MALVECDECKRSISNRAASCPHCGAPMQRILPPAGTSSTSPAHGAYFDVLRVVMWLIVGAVLISVAMSSLFRGSDREDGAAAVPAPVTPVAISAPKPDPRVDQYLEITDNVDKPKSERIAAAQALLADFPNSEAAPRTRSLLTMLEKAPEITTGTQWNYTSQPDAMSDGTVRSASVTSTNSFEFDFPYQGQQQAVLQLRRHPRWGKDVVFYVQKGQLLCNSSSCPVRVKFDNEPARTFEGSEPADNSSDTVFIPAFSTFISKLRAAKIVRIEIEVFHHGTLMTEFNVEGFDAAQLSGKS